MTKSQKEEQEREHSQYNRKHSQPSNIKKKTQNRLITNYFVKMDTGKPFKKINIAPQSPPETNKDRILAEKMQEVKMRMTSQKQKHRMMMLMVRAAIIKEVKSMAQIDRLSAKQAQFVLNNRKSTILMLQQKNRSHQKTIDFAHISSLQRYFLEQQVSQTQQQIRRIEHQVLQLENQLHLREQEENSYLAKQQWPLIHKKYQSLRLIGKGGFSQVYQAYDLENHKLIALKLSDVDHLVAGRGDVTDYLRHIKRQYQVHKRLDHPNIVKLIEVIDSQSTIFIALQYCQGPTLSEKIKKEGRIKQRQAKLIIHQLLQVIDYLSRQRVVHFDLKPQNIMFNEGCLKVLDFGICKVFDSQHSRMALTSQGMGTFCYLPPQAFVANPTLTNKVDIWSLGVIFYEMLFGQRPANTDIIPLQQLTFPPKTIVSNQAKEFLKGCLQSSLVERMDPEQALRHSYFQS